MAIIGGKKLVYVLSRLVYNSDKVKELEREEIKKIILGNDRMGRGK